jgi:predicted Rossmann fold flavoprotein
LARYDAIVLGAGAAGLFCAAMAGRRGKRVLVLEHGEKPGAKILISGGGRCNFTNLAVSAENFLSDNPHFAKSALAGFTPADFIALVEEAGIAFHEKRLGQLFCDGSAREILALLTNLCAAGGVEIRLEATVTAVSRPGLFVVESGGGADEAEALVVATGGLSIPKMGATGFGYELARHFGLRVVALKPGLVPLVFGAEARGWMEGLAGVSFETVARAGKAVFREAALFTHRGLSGPAVLQASSYLAPGAALTLDLLPEVELADWLIARKAARGRAALKTVLAELLPARLVAHLAPADLADRALGDIAHKRLGEVAARLTRLVLHPAGDEGYAKAEVTVGGVDTRDLRSASMEARDVPGLFMVGEVVDVTGWLGGYNFQWAWASGFAAAQAL